ncbi:unnamed protein product [Lota lota]
MARKGRVQNELIIAQTNCDFDVFHLRHVPVRLLQWGRLIWVHMAPHGALPRKQDQQQQVEMKTDHAVTREDPSLIKDNQLAKRSLILRPSG